jgi:hypothetical protein
VKEAARLTQYCDVYTPYFLAAILNEVAPITFEAGFGGFAFFGVLFCAAVAAFVGFCVCSVHCHNKFSPMF